MCMNSVALPLRYREVSNLAQIPHLVAGGGGVGGGAQGQKAAPGPTLYPFLITPSQLMEEIWKSGATFLQNEAGRRVEPTLCHFS